MLGPESWHIKRMCGLVSGGKGKNLILWTKDCRPFNGKTDSWRLQKKRNIHTKEKTLGNHKDDEKDIVHRCVVSVCAQRIGSGTR